MKWYNDCTIYQVYIRSVGTFNEIAKNINYYVDLGVNCLWINPFYPHGNKDGGYDILDYYNVSEEFGTLEDFKNLVKIAHKNNIKIITDLVCNHTSDQHQWFKDSVNMINDKTDWYCWKPNTFDPKSSNWISEFVDTPFTYNEERKQYYYHFFYSEQPDLNFKCLDVQNEFFKIMSFWLDLGVDGFRLDAVSHLMEGEGNNESEVFEKQINADENFDYWKKVRLWIDSNYPDAVLLAETNCNHTTPDMIDRYNDIFHLVMDFNFLKEIDTNKNNIMSIKLNDIVKNNNTKNPVYFLNNHDMLRNRYGEESSKDIAEHLAKLLLTIKGCKIIYYGEEQGMKNIPNLLPYPENRISARGKFEYIKNDRYFYYQKLIKKKM